MTDLRQLFEMVNEACGGAWTLRRNGKTQWYAFTEYGPSHHDHVEGDGATPEEALQTFLAAILTYAQSTGQQHEDTARKSREWIARIQRVSE